MSAFDRDPAVERRQILEISANVARRLLAVLDRSRYASPALKREVDEAVTVITGIQRDVDQIVSGMPGYEALDIAILTHILGGQQHALERLEDLEAKLRGSVQTPTPFDPARTHAALIATAREIERDALRYGASHPVTQPPRPAFAGAAGFDPPPQYAQPAPLRQAAGANPAAPASVPPKPRAANSRPPRSLSHLLGEHLANRRARTAAVVLAVTLAAAGGWSLIPAPLGHQPAETAAEPLQAESTPPPSGDPRASAFTHSLATAAGPGPAAEQPYLVVLATRRSTEELQQDYRGFKQTYGELLTGSKARVDRIQGQDRQTYYRLSLIPPQSRGEAKALCRKLRVAGLSGCWIRQVPMN